MNYTIEYPINNKHLTTSQHHNVSFITVTYGDYKANIVCEYFGFMDFSPIMKGAFFRLRDINDNIIKTNAGNIKTKIRGKALKDFRSAVHYIDSSKGIKEDNENTIALIVAILISSDYSFNSKKIS